LSGEGVSQDIKEAVDWLNKAAEQGNAKAQYNLGHLFYNGEVVPQNYEKAFEFMNNAAEQGIGYAHHMLCLMYDNGIGVAENPEKAFECCMDAINHGCAEAKAYLEHMAASGRVPSEYKRGMSLVRDELARQLLGEEGLSEDEIVIIKMIETYSRGSKDLSHFHEFYKAINKNLDNQFYVQTFLAISYSLKRYGEFTVIYEKADAMGSANQTDINAVYAYLMIGLPERASEIADRVEIPEELHNLISEETNKKIKSKNHLLEALDKFLNADFQEGSDLGKKAFELYPFGVENMINSLVYAIDNNTEFSITEQRINFTKEEHAYFLLHQCIYRIKRNDFCIELINLIHNFCDAVVSLYGEEKKIDLGNIPSKICLYTKVRIVEAPLQLAYNILLHGYEKCKEKNLELGDYGVLVALYKEASQIQLKDENIPVVPV
jgi:DNA-binding FadR family transcriptional regulator